LQLIQRDLKFCGMRYLSWFWYIVMKPESLRKTRALYRITRTKAKLSLPDATIWTGLCVVVELDDKVLFPDGEEYTYKRVSQELRLLDGPHRGVYKLDKIF